MTDIYGLSEAGAPWRPLEDQKKTIHWQLTRATESNPDLDARIHELLGLDGEPLVYTGSISDAVTVLLGMSWRKESLMRKVSPKDPLKIVVEATPGSDWSKRRWAAKCSKLECGIVAVGLEALGLSGELGIDSL